MTKASPDFFNSQAAQNYDEKNAKLQRISDSLHFLTGLVLKNLPARSKILCVGAGTGAEILSLAQMHPEWSFIALAPSASMLEVCRQRVQTAGLSERCQFVQGYVQDLPLNQKYDAALSVLVAHFVPRTERLEFFRQMSLRLHEGGYMVNAEISFDLDSPEAALMQKNWESIQSLMGATEESLASLPKVLREVLTVLPPTETEDLIRQAGFQMPIRFFQAFMISAWYATKVTK